MEPWWTIHCTPISMHTRLAGPWGRLSSLVYKTERHLKKGLSLWELLWALKVCLTPPSSSMCKAAEEQGVEQGVVCTMFESQKILMAQMGCRLRVSVGWGCPHGGVLSLLLWSLVVDGLLAWLNKECLCMQMICPCLCLGNSQVLPQSSCKGL
jgi:hypothetical protein